MDQKILLALDITDKVDAIRLLKVAEELAVQKEQELHVVTVVPTYNMPIVGSYFGAGNEDEALEHARELLKTFLSENAHGEEMVKGHIAHGSIYEEIMNVADKLGVTLIVMGAHRPELADYLLGPNASRVARHAKQSVFVVRH